MKLLCWNVNGIRSALSKGLQGVIAKENPDIFCLQETKAHENQLASVAELFPGYHVVYSSALQKGYSGVATFYRENLSVKNHGLGIGMEKFDQEGRFLISEFSAFTLYNIYFPSGTSGETRQGFKYEFLDIFYEHLNKKTHKRFIIVGDFNICHKAIDIHHPKQAEKLQLTGFLPEERAWMDKFTDLGFTDTFRKINGQIKDSYTWWSFRANSRQKNLGWRIDYIFTGSDLVKTLKSAQIHADIAGSDHCPISAEFGL